jgi:membrane protein YqaA with SNARE-associated domain
LDFCKKLNYIEFSGNQLNHFNNQFLIYIATLHECLQQPGYPSLFLLSFLASTLLPLGSEWLLVLMLLKGYPPVTAIITATAGNSMGAFTTYLVGLYGGKWLIEKVFRISESQQERAKNYYRRYGAYSLFFSWVPIIGDPLCLVGGMMRVNIWLFVAFVVSGKLLRYIIVGWIALKSTG